MKGRAREERAGAERDLTAANEQLARAERLSSEGARLQEQLAEAGVQGPGGARARALQLEREAADLEIEARRQEAGAHYLVLEAERLQGGWVWVGG